MRRSTSCTSALAGGGGGRARAGGGRHRGHGRRRGVATGVGGDRRRRRASAAGVVGRAPSSARCRSAAASRRLPARAPTAGHHAVVGHDRDRALARRLHPPRRAARVGRRVRGQVARLARRRVDQRAASAAAVAQRARRRSASAIEPAASRSGARACSASAPRARCRRSAAAARPAWPRSRRAGSRSARCTAAAAQEPVDDAVVRDPAEALERAGAAARDRRGRRAAAGATGPEIRRGWTGAVRGRVTVACSGMSALLPELAGGPEASRLRSGVGRDLARRGHDRAAVHELRLRRVAADADGQVGRADAAAGLLGEEALDAPVLERVEGQRGERGRRPSATSHASGSASSSCCELAVDGDPDRLERALGRVAAGEARGRGDRRRRSRR